MSGPLRGGLIRGSDGCSAPLPRKLPSSSAHTGEGGRHTCVASQTAPFAAMHRHAMIGCASDTTCARSEASSANTDSSNAGEARDAVGASSAMRPGARRLRGGAVAVALIAEVEASVEGNGVSAGDAAVQSQHRGRPNTTQIKSLNIVNDRRKRWAARAWAGTHRRRRDGMCRRRRPRRPKRRARQRG